MLLIGKKIAFALTDPFPMFERTISQISKLIEEGAQILPIISIDYYNINNQFENVKNCIGKIEKLTGKKVIYSLEDVELVEVKILTDVMVIAPCSGNTIAKLALGISDTPVLVAAKSHLKNDKPLIIGISAHDGLSRQ